MRQTAFLLLVGLAMLPPVSAHAQAPSDEAVLQAGDAVRITVWRKPEMSGDFQVAVDGTVKHPLYRGLHVAGVPMDTIERRLNALLSGYESSPEFLVEPLFRVALAGEVRKPDLYTLPIETTVAQALALAGGPTEEGRLDRVRLVREGRVEILDLSRPSAAGLRTIRSGDQILVGRRANVLRDYIGPIASVLAAVAVVLNVVVLR